MSLKEEWKKDENQSMKGWDFSHIDQRWEEETLPFDYKKTVLSYLEDHKLLLDMGTGGGELLLSLNHPYEKSCATEGYPPNLDYCIDHLAPKGITVKGIKKDGKIPFENNMFDIIINRHSYYDIHEVKRVLKDDGIFITQQIGSLNNQELSRVFIPGFELANKNNYLDKQKTLFNSNGFSVLESMECFPKIKFFDLGALCFFCKSIVWEFPDFSVDKYYDKLLKLHEVCMKDGFIESSEHRFMLVCQKKA